MKISRQKIFLIFFIYILVATSKGVAEVELLEKDKIVSVSVRDVQEPGVGSYYLVLTYQPNDAKVLNLTSDFLMAYNVVNYTILVAGVQGSIPGPVGEVHLADILFDQQVTVTVLLVEIKDVYGNLIYAYTSNNASAQSQFSDSSTHTPTTSAGVVTKTPEQTETPTPPGQISNHASDVPSQYTPTPVTTTTTPGEGGNGNSDVSDISQQVTPVTTTTTPGEGGNGNSGVSQQVSTIFNSIKKIPIGNETIFVTLFIWLVISLLWGRKKMG